MSNRVWSGLDQLSLVDGKLLGRRVGLMTNPTGVDHDLRSAIDLIAARYDLTALLACEHGVRGAAQAGDDVETFVDEETGVTVYSAYSGDHHLTDEMLDAFDVMVFDIQDVGSRFYTYVYSLAYAMEDCARAGKGVVVLDRVNPIGGVKRGGTVIEPRFDSFVGAYGIPTQHGLTMGEMALYIRDFLGLDVDLTVAPLRGWKREMYLDDTDLPWVAPSPNCPALSSALCFTATCIFEGTNLSEGRGTTQPFELIGAPWVNALELERRMASLDLPGAHFRRAAFVPTFSKHAGQLCYGVQLHVVDRAAYRAFESGLFLLDTIRSLHAEQLAFLRWSPDSPPAIDRLMGTDEYRTGACSARELIEKHAPRVAAFSERVKPLLLYQC